MVEATPHGRRGVPPGRRRPTMIDVAARAGVSLKTVSRVINEEPGVSGELAERVDAAVSELGFRPNSSASMLRRSNATTSSIALLLEDVSNPFSASVLRAVEDVAAEHGSVVFAASLDEDPVRERHLVELFAGRRPDGILVVPAGDDHLHLQREMQAGMAIVFVDRPPGRLPADSVLSTNAAGTAEGVRHLLAQGHRRIAFLGDQESLWTTRERLRGFEQAHIVTGVSPQPDLIMCDLTDVAAADGAAMRMFMSPDPPTAVFAGQNLVTIGVIRALRRLGLQDRIALVGFDDFPLADLLQPAITVVAQDPSAIGRTAARILFARLSGDSSEYAERLVPTTLVRRGSGEIRP